MRATNGIPLGSSLLLPVCTVNCTQTLKAKRFGWGCGCGWDEMLQGEEVVNYDGSSLEPQKKLFAKHVAKYKTFLDELYGVRVFRQKSTLEECH
jgi:hypothetical protein